MRLILLGPPGLGKGTQAELLTKKYGVVHISSGDILRKAVEDRTEAGVAAQPYMHAGDLVPDSILLAIHRDVLHSPAAARGFILDGFPRTIDQTRSLESLLKDMHIRLDAVVLLSGGLEEIQRRIAGRRVCRVCGHTFNLNEPGQESLSECPECHVPLTQRDDDRPETVKHRFEVYHERTEPVIEHFRKNGLLRTVNGEASVERVFEEIVRILG